MKTNFGPFKDSPLSAIRSDEQFQEILKHILSPLEMEAFKNDFQGFYYNLDGKQVAIEPGYGKPLMNMCMAKIRMFSEILSKINYTLLGDSEKHKLFLLQKIESAELPTYLINRLRGHGCKTVLDVLNIGKKRIAQSRGIGKAGLKTIHDLFKKNGCGLLFN